MGYYVHLHVCFPCDANEAVAALAKDHLTPELDCDDERPVELTVKRHVCPFSWGQK